MMEREIRKTTTISERLPSRGPSRDGRRRDVTENTRADWIRHNVSVANFVAEWTNDRRPDGRNQAQTDGIASCG